MTTKYTQNKSSAFWGKKIWILNMVLVSAYVLMQTPGHLWLMSVSQGNPAKSFNGAMMPIAFVPDWRKSDYIDQRGNLNYSSVKQNDLIPLPRIEAIKNDFNSNFTYLTVFRGKYMDEERSVGSGSHDGVDIRAPIGTPIFAIANGKIIKTRDEDNNKYITIEHRDVKYGGRVGKFYSSYLHLSTVLVQPGDNVDKGTLIGRVGMTGMTTTPHLHIQIDNDEAPFYPYWPFDYSAASDAGLSMYEAVDAGLNQDLILKYSVDPLDFIKKATTIDGQSVAGSRTEYIPTETVAPVVNNKNSKTEIIPKIVTQNNAPLTPGTFKDVNTNHPFYNSISYFSKKGVVKGYTDGNFKPEKNITRSEALGLIMSALKVESKGEVITGIFSDIPKESSINGNISEAVKQKIISADKKLFYPDRNINKVEFLAILIKASNEALPVGITKNWDDIKWSDWYYRYAVFALQNNLFENISGKMFKPGASLTRGEVLEGLYRYLRVTNKL